VSSFGPTPSLIRIVAAVDLILEAVEKSVEDGTTSPAPRDIHDAFLGAAYGRAYRCMRSIRDLAFRGEADDALILTRALVSLVGRSLYVVQPDDAAEREERSLRWMRTWARDMGKAADALVAAGFEPSDPEERADLARLTGAGPFLPDDRQLLGLVGLEAHHARVYRFASDVAHYSMGSALDGFVEYPTRESGGQVTLRLPDANRAEEALLMAALVYGEFLARSEPLIGHGVTPLAERVLGAHVEARSAEAEG
jgi:hypothetical protein